MKNMMCNIFYIEQVGLDAQQVDYEKDKAARYDGNDEYWDNVTKWAEVRQRITDGIWFYEVCPNGVQTHMQEEYKPEWEEDVSD